MPELHRLIGAEVELCEGAVVRRGRVVAVRPYLDHLRRVEDLAAARHGRPMPTGAEVVARYDLTEEEAFADVLVLSVRHPDWPGPFEVGATAAVVERVRAAGGAWVEFYARG